MKKILLINLLLLTNVFYGQRKYFADKYFNDFAYKKAAELYEGIYAKGDSTAYVISRIGDSYYNNSAYKEASNWYAKLLSDTTNNEEIDSEYYFKYAQTLKSNGNIEESDKWMLKFRNVNGLDSRSEALVNHRDYFSDYTGKNTVYINIHNLSINTGYSDFGSFIYDNNLFFASSKPKSEDKKERTYKWNDQPFLNIYAANQKDIDLDAKILDVEISSKFKDASSKYHESSIVFTNDGNTIYFTRDNYNGRKLGKDKEKSVNLKIYRVDKVDGKLSDAVELPFNSDEYSVGHPALSADENTLYFVSDMPGGIGQTDIYKVSIEDHKTYGDPQNLGDLINTEGKEMFPFIDKKNTLYFSSNGQLGLGALDIFESKVNEKGIFTTPVNMGTPINSPMDDFAFVVNEDITNGYFSSNREGGKGDDDIYSFIISICNESIEGAVTDINTQKPIEGATVRLIDASGKIIEEYITKADGKYSFTDLLCETDFKVVASKQDYREDKKQVTTIDVDKKVIEANLQLEAFIKVPEVKEELPQIVIRPIYFDFDKYYIRKDAKYELEHIVDVMKNNPTMVIKIESHTDSRATKSYNRALSDNRAKSTRDYIISRGISANRIESAIGYGENRLLNHCNDANINTCSKEEHQLNRRSYFYITKGANNIKVTEQIGE